MKEPYLLKHLIKSFITNLEKDLYNRLSDLDVDLNYQEYTWFFKDTISKFIWYSMIDRRTKEYKDYKKKIQGEQ